MVYATPVELRARYLVGLDQDEFALRDDANLEQALAAAAAEIDGYRLPGTPSPAALLILKDKCLTLARMLVNQDQALSAEHPIVRDGLRVFTWLKDLSRGVVKLPAADAEDVGGGADWASAPTAWGRGEGGGL
ncbi:phage protein Gp36 family protein [Candidatus Thiodictyon syntrophicum]|jgi:phage gp36-like protein|uniref:DUF1320 domain-containing protein n=1 Tax=Candidatus Thiodictyon syntrophicum TaxID=1166950 RepID=A0A2K8U8T0_9GAMM|nr:phage protein Gp36 family protein [Candidatus Thiodictyon syntrophicum]AUB81451.1 hypothetical protein THSYN_11130 [Candidatus Thiodictyon syntrophicum]